MANFIKCECCGGEMRLLEDGVTAECEYCYRRAIWKEPKSEALVLEMNRANMQRRANRFSDAIMSYRMITEKNPKDAEAWWGLVLSTYGIEYVKDPRGGYVPTCHRTVREEIFENEDYRKAYRNAAESQRAEYENEAKEIDRLQKEILRLADAGEDFDVFISFKSKDKAGRMTKDAQIARTIYDELDKRGIKTFFSDVTLQSKMFSDYEPIIYRALISCKYFVLVGTSDEYIQSEWVKNEWSRFEERMEREKLSGVACAVFDGGTVKELPAFLRAQGADLRDYPAGGYEIRIADAVEAKMGRKKKSREEEELLRQIEAQKIAQRELEERLKEMKSSGGAEQNQTSATVNSLLTRGEQELEAKNWDEARAYYNRVLDADPKNAEAWWGLFSAGEKADYLRESNIEKFVDKLTLKTYSAIVNSRNYVNARKYAAGNFKEKLKRFEEILELRAKHRIAVNRDAVAELTREQGEIAEEEKRQASRLAARKAELQKKDKECRQKIDKLQPLVDKWSKKSDIILFPWFLLYLPPLIPVGVVFAIFVTPILAVVRRKNENIFLEYSRQLKFAQSDSAKIFTDIKKLDTLAEENKENAQKGIQQSQMRQNSLEEENQTYTRFCGFVSEDPSAQ